MLDTTANPALNTPQQVAGKAGPTPSGSRPAGPRWHVVATHSQAERRATYNLAQQGYETYLPLVTVRRRDAAIRSLIHRVEVPLFAGYVFVRFDATARSMAAHHQHPRRLRACSAPPAPDYPTPAQTPLWKRYRRGRGPPPHPHPSGSAWSPGAACSPAHGPSRGARSRHDLSHRPKATIALPLFGSRHDVSVATSRD